MKTKLFFLFVILVAADQFLKGTSSAFFCNKNIAWSIPAPTAIFYFVWTIIIVVLTYIFAQTKNYTQKIFVTLIFAGAASNIIDRIRLGCVVDYIDLKIFPVFNLADLYITLGIILIVIQFLKPTTRD